PPRCVPAKAKPLADFTNDCVVDYKDLKVIADNWLKGPIEPNAPVGWWKLDEGQGDIAHDSSVYGSHGTIVGDYSWVAGCYGWNWAVEFIEGKVVVADSPWLRPPTQVSVCAWVRYSVTGGYSARIVVKGADSRETYCLEVDDDDRAAFVFRDVNGVFHGVDGTAELSHNEWVHIAGTYDGYAINCYVNGAFDSSATITPVLLSQDVNDLAIANRSDANDRQFEGAVDDVRVYDYGLTQDEIMWVAGDCGGVGPCRLIPNLYCGLEPEIINFEDYGVLAGMWLEQILWP
ncbi:MAG: LamG domain-containing protein, partial [Planctomycetota bacterium]